MAAERKQVIRICGDLAGHFTNRNTGIQLSEGAENCKLASAIANIEPLIGAEDRCELEKEQHAA